VCVCVCWGAGGVNNILFGDVVIAVVVVVMVVVVVTSQRSLVVE
jgi:hypothetical protein